MKIIGQPAGRPATGVARRVETVGAFVLTFRRRDSLAETLKGILRQSRHPNAVTVLNCDVSSPMKATLPQAFRGVEVIDLAENLGSGGGYHEALRRAGQRGFTWAWLFDDDSAPEAGALSELLRAASERADSEPIGMVAPVQVSPRSAYGVSLWRDRLVPLPRELCYGTAPVDVDAAYWAGLLVHRRVLDTIGYPRAEFFRCFADYEYCLRARMAGLRVVAVPTSRILHDTGPPKRIVWFGRPSIRHRYEPSRYYYHVRNAAYTTRFVVRSPRAAFLHTVRQFRHAAGDLVYSDRKLRRLWLRLLALVDGFRGRLGRRLDLEE